MGGDVGEGITVSQGRAVAAFDRLRKEAVRDLKSNTEWRGREIRGSAERFGKV